MSAEALSKLSLGDTMVTTRAGAKRARTTTIQTPTQSPQQSPVSSEAPSPTPSLIESDVTGLKYNVSAFDDVLRRRAKIGMMDGSDIKMKYCRESPDGRMKYTFYINDDITVAMGKNYTTPRCSCGANEEGRACKHIFWMLDHLASGAPKEVKSQTLQLAEDGSKVHIFEAAEIVDKWGIENLAEEFHWEVQHGQSPNPKDIENEIAEMLSVFEPSNALPSESKDPSACPSERSQKYREFRDLFTEYATENLGMFLRLKRVIKKDFQAQVFFDKINDRIARTFRALEEYMANGPTADALTESYDIPTCAGKLKGLVKAISDYYQQQVDNEDEEEDDDDDDEDYTTKIAIGAAAALIHILDGVVERNRDAYANITWGGIPPVDPAENNLFVNLIQDQKGDDPPFVLDTLEDLPHEAISRNHWELLHRLEERLMQQLPPQKYMNAFRAITQESRKRGASLSSEAGGSSSKRLMN